MPSDVKQEFLSTVCAFVRFRPARAGIARELSAHIDDLAAQKQVLGLEKDEALATAVSEMGDPAEVGKSLNLAHRPRVEWTVAALALLLIGIGLALQYILSQNAPSIFGSFGRVALYTLAGFAVLFAAAYFGPAALRRIPWAFLALGSLFLLVVFLIDFQHKWSANFFRIRSLAYYTSLLLIPVYSAVLERLKNLRGWGVVLACVLYAVVALLLVSIPYLLAALFWCLCCVVLLTSAIVRGRFAVNKKAALGIVYGIGLLICGGMLLFILQNGGYRADRLRALIDTTGDPNGSTYFFSQLHDIVSAAQPFGLGKSFLTEDIVRSSILLNPDYSLTYVLYRFGTVPATMLVLLFAAFFARMLAAVRKLRNEAARLQSLAVLLSLGVQTVFYILFNLGLLNPMGATLPFVSFGAVSCLVNMGLLGLLLGNYRVKDVIRVEQVGAMRGLSREM